MLLPTIHVKIKEKETEKIVIDDYFKGVSSYTHDYTTDELVIEYEGGTHIISSQDINDVDEFVAVIEVIS